VALTMIIIVYSLLLAVYIEHKPKIQLSGEIQQKVAELQLIQRCNITEYTCYQSSFVSVIRRLVFPEHETFFTRSKNTDCRDSKRTLPNARYEPIQKYV